MSEPNVKGRWESFLPDEILISILSRLEPKDVLRCRLVAKRWRDLTFTPYFVDLHKQHGVVRIVLVDVPKRKRDLRDQYFLDEWWIRSRKKPSIQTIFSHPSCYSGFSQDGFLFLSSTECRCRKDIVIVNPIFRDMVKLVISKEWHSSIRMVYGVYFNPTIQEYCALLQVTTNVNSSVPLGYIHLLDIPPTKKPLHLTYKVLTLGPKPCLRDVKSPFIDWYATSELETRRPAMIDRYIYWLVDVENASESSRYYGDIMEFNTRSDEFKLMEYPGQMIADAQLDLLNVDGFLTLVQIAQHNRAVAVNIFTLKDRASKLWIYSPYYVDHKVFPNAWWIPFETIDVRCGEILIQTDDKLYICNLEQGRAKVLGNKSYNKPCKFLSHNVCLSSLKNCKPVIRIGNRKKCHFCIKLDKKVGASSSNSEAYEYSDVVEQTAISGSK